MPKLEISRSNLNKSFFGVVILKLGLFKLILLFKLQPVPRLGFQTVGLTLTLKVYIIILVKLIRGLPWGYLIPIIVNLWSPLGDLEQSGGLKSPSPFHITLIPAILAFISVDH